MSISPFHAFSNDRPASAPSLQDSHISNLDGESFSARLRGMLRHIFRRAAFTARDGIIVFGNGAPAQCAVAPSANVRSLRRLALSKAGEAPALAFEIAGGVILKEKIEAKGLHEVSARELSGESFRNLAASCGQGAVLLECQVRARSGLSDQAKVLALPKDYDGPIFICDIDDTLRSTNLLKVALGLQQEALPGVGQLLKEISALGVPIVYLSAAPDYFRPYNEAFLADFPAGVLINRPSAELRSFLKPNASQALAQGSFKSSILGKILKAAPRAKLFGLGDDNYGDAIAYSNHSMEAFILDVRPGESNFPAHFAGTQLCNYSPETRRLIVEKVEQARQKSSSFGFPAQESNYYSILGEKLDRLTKTKASPGNQIQLLIDGTDTAQQILGAIKSAQRSIYFECYEFARNDLITKEISEELIKARNRGVAVHIVLDAVGSRHFPLYRHPQIEQLLAAGIDLQIYNPLKQFFSKGFERDHRKVLVVDQHSAFLGGRNTGDAYLDSSWSGSVHDLHAKISGPAVREIIRHFADSYNSAAGRELLSAGAEISAQEEKQPGRGAGELKVRIVAHVPNADKNIRAVYLSLINHAQDHIFIENPYPFSKDIVLALKSAAERGVKVRVVIGKPSGPIDDVARAIMPVLLRAGVRVYAYPERIHTKAISIDGKVCAFGSSNFDEVALQHNREIVAVVEDAKFAAELENKLFVRDFFYTAPNGERTKKYKHSADDPWYRKLFKETLLVLWPERFK